MLKKLGFAALACTWLATPSFAAETMTIETSKGCSFAIKLRSDLAPKHVAQYSKLAAAGFDNGVVFHPGDRGLHGADRRSHRHRLRRFQ